MLGPTSYTGLVIKPIVKSHRVSAHVYRASGAGIIRFELTLVVLGLRQTMLAYVQACMAKFVLAPHFLTM